MFAGHVPFESIKGMEKAHGKRGTGSHPAPGREVPIVVNLYPAVDLEVPQNFSNGRVRNLIDGLAAFDLGVNYTDPVFEEGRQVAAGQIAIFVYRCGEHCSAMLTKPGRVVSSPAKKRDSIGSSADNHELPPQEKNFWASW